MNLSEVDLSVSKIEGRAFIEHSTWSLHTLVSLSWEHQRLPCIILLDKDISTCMYYYYCRGEEDENAHRISFRTRKR